MGQVFVTSDRLAMVCQEWRRDILSLDERLAKMEKHEAAHLHPPDVSETFLAELEEFRKVTDNFTANINGRLRGMELALEMERGSRERNFGALSEAYLELEDDKVGNLQVQVYQLQLAVKLLLPIAILGADAKEEGETETAQAKLAKLITAWKV